MPSLKTWKTISKNIQIFFLRLLYTYAMVVIITAIPIIIEGHETAFNGF
jgi:hypothetical protein